MESFIPCICSAVCLTIEELVKMRIKMEKNDISVSEDLLRLLQDIKKYDKKDRAIIREYLKLYLIQTASRNSSQASSSQLVS
jgi:hypothetical protein